MSRFSPQSSNTLRELLRERLFGNATAETRVTDSLAGTMRAHLSETTGTGAETEARALLDEVRRPPTERFEAQGEVGRGGMGSVEAFQDHALRRKAVRKVIHEHLKQKPQIVRCLIREAQIMAQLDHPNIVPIHDVGVLKDDQLHFSMKLVRGKTLGQVVAESPKRALEPGELLDLLDVIVRVCNALAFAHDRHIVHCDVKPDNVMVGDYGEVYLMDWGIALSLKPPPTEEPDAETKDSSTEARDTLESSGLLGTPVYMSPEQAQGALARIDRRTDVFAVGGLLYYILARRPPFRGTTLWEVLERVEVGRWEPLANVVPDGVVPKGLARIIHKAMARDQKERYQNVGALKHDLVQFMRGGAEFRVEHFAAGDVVIREGDAGDRAYIIVSGRCDVYKDGPSGRKFLRSMGSGNVFGEMAILTSSARTVSVIAAEDTVVRVVTRDALEAEVSDLKPWMSVLIRSLAERLLERERDASG